jgi:YidC/Oxa1 family membrane protein insertase
MPNIWNLLILNPMINALIWFYGLLGNNYLLAIVITTALTRLIVFPLTWQQQKSSVAMQELQPQLMKLREKYKDDMETQQRKQMELYREAGVNPLGGCLPLIIQMPILLGFYQAITRSLAASPLQLIDLSQHLYQHIPPVLSWLPVAQSLIPLNSYVLGLNLAAAAKDPFYILPVLVVLSTLVQNRLLTPPSSASSGDQQAAMTRSMQIFMPLFIGYISITFPSGLAVYWIVSNIIGIAQYAAMGRATLKNLFGTEDGSFSLPGLLGLSVPQEATSSKGQSRRKQK